MIPAREALERLRAGNARFKASVGKSGGEGQPAPAQLPADQHPFAIIVGCSDSRVPAEMVFGQGLGDLFVIRVAGNIPAPSVVGSAEFAVAKFGTKLVVVLGHTGCGAIQATIDELRAPAANASPGLKFIIDRVRPSVEKLMQTELRNDPDDLVGQAVRANVLATARHLRYESPILKPLVSREELLVVGAEYSLGTGAVDFFDVPRESIPIF